MILVLLFTATLVVGVLTLWHSSNDTEAVERFRSLFSTSTVYELKHSMPSIIDPSSLVYIIDLSSLVYGGISLFAIILIVLNVEFILSYDDDDYDNEDYDCKLMIENF